MGVPEIVRSALNLRGRGAQTALADELGVAPQTVNKWVKGQTSPDLPKWHEIERALDINEGTFARVVSVERYLAAAQLPGDVSVVIEDEDLDSDGKDTLWLGHPEHKFERWTGGEPLTDKVVRRAVALFASTLVRIDLAPRETLSIDGDRRWSDIQGDRLRSEPVGFRDNPRAMYRPRGPGTDPNADPPAADALEVPLEMAALSGKLERLTPKKRAAVETLIDTMLED